MWHEAKKSEKKVHELMDTARKRAMRRAEFLAKRRGDPHQSIQLFGSRCRIHRDDGLYHAAQDQIGLIPWNGKEDNLIDRFDGRALLDFIRESGSRPFKAQEKTEEEEELEQFVNFESYRDLIKHRRRGFSEEEGLKYIQQELEAKNTISLNFDKPKKPQPKGSYSQVGFSYNNNNNNNYNNNNGDDNDNEDSESESEESDDEFSSDDSNDEKMEIIAKDFGIKRYNWLVYSEKKAKEEVKRQKELIKGDPSIKKLSRRERRKISQMEREKERYSARFSMRGPQDPYRDPRRSPSYENYSRRRRSRSRSKSPSSYSRRHHHEKSKAPKIEYITEFGAGPACQTKDSWQSPPSSPVQSDPVTRSMGGQSQILEALHSDPASLTRTIEQDKTPKFVKAPLSSGSSSSGLAKLSKSVTPGGSSKTPIGEKKETPQERLKRIMSSQLNKQIKKDTAAEQAKRREQEKERRERLAELSRLSRRSRSRSSSHDRSRHRSRSSSCDRSRHRSRDRSRSRGRSRSRSPRRRRRYSRSPRRYGTKSRSPSPRSRSRSRH